MSLTHKVKSSDTYVKTYLNGIYPLCECGCGETTNFLGENKGFRRFLTGHNSSTSNNNFHKNPESKIKSAKTQSENWKNGKYVGWWENNDDETKEKIEGIKEKLRNNKERGEKISKSLSGVNKSEEHKQKISKSQIKRYEENPELREKLSKRRIKWLKTKLSKNKSLLEIKFEGYLDYLNIIYEYQYEIGKKLYDFYIPSKNTLIEVDGDFYHCNPESTHNKPKYKCQFLTIKNDKNKNTYCEKNEIKLIRFWEKDINERPEWVISELKKYL